jgi:tRNA (guanine-N7-)-methyltransferase
VKRKLERFKEIEERSNVIEPTKEIYHYVKGKWNQDIFQNESPITIELACGRGEYTVGLANLFPNKNFIGVDVKGNRMYIGAKKALNNKLSNAAFLRTQIEMLPDYFAKGEVSEIWITFPDPQLRFSKAKKRLIHPKFLRMYQQFLEPDGRIHLKTDSPDLYDFTKTVIEFHNCNLIADDPDVFSKKEVLKELQIKTHYESLDIAGHNRIHYLCFSLPADLGDREKDKQLKEKLKESEGAD